jgi:putative flavoprotein involved in K+ transport
MQGPEDGRLDVAVIGAGAAGLGVAAELRRRGIDPVLLERGEEVGASWRPRYDGLRLNSSRGVSGVRGVRMPAAAGRFPSREAYADYLAACAGRLGVDVRLGVEVFRIDDLDGDGYALETSVGELRARCVLVAAGYDRVAEVPDWPGRESFGGELLHACEYRDPEPFAGRDVLVVGTGNSGTEIAAQLASGGAGRVWVAMRTPVNVLPRQFLGVPMSAAGLAARRLPDAVVDAGCRLVQRLTWGDLSRHGMPRAPMGVGTELRRKGLGPVVDGGFVAALKARRVSLVGALERFDGEEVVLDDGARLRPHAVIAATGYRHGLEELVGHLGVLSSSGRPEQVDGCAHPAAPGLHFNGYWQPLPGQLPGMRITSRRIAREVARELRRPEGAPRRAPRACRRPEAVAS